MFRLGLFLFVTSPLWSYGQSGTFILNDIDQNVLNPDLLERRYEKMSGSPYFNEDFVNGSVHFKNGQQIVNQPLRLDLYSHGVQVNVEETLEYPDKFVDSLFFENNDGNTIVFKSLVKEGKPTLFRVITEGYISFYSLEEAHIKVSDVTQTGYSNKSELDRFVKSQAYYLLMDNEFHEIKLNKKSVLAVLGQTSELSSYLKMQGNKLKNEADVSALINHQNLNL